MKESKLESYTIDAIEENIGKLKESSRDAQVKMYEMLYYLERSRRYKENKRYTKSDFKQYIEDRHGIAYYTYLENRKASVNFRQEVVDFGVGLVSKATRMCGVDKVADVFNEVRKLDEVGKRECVPRKKVEEILILNAKPEKLIKKEHNDWRAMYENEKAEHDRTKALCRSLSKENEALKRQVEKLKESSKIGVLFKQIMEKNHITVGM